MLRQEIFKRRKSVRRDIKRGNFNVGEKSVEIFGLEYNFRERLMADALAKHCATVESNLLVFIPAGRKHGTNMTSRTEKQPVTMIHDTVY